jgi:hypothetical protein
MFAAVFILLPVLSAAQGNDAMGELQATIARLADQYSRNRDIQLPILERRDIERLAEGQSLVSAYDRPGTGPGDDVEAMGLLGMQLVDAPRMLVWITLLRGGGRSGDNFITATLSRNTAGSYTRYQYVNLPWPVRDRHWVIYCEKNLAIAHISDGAIWEHQWALQDNGEQLLRTAFEKGAIGALTPRKLNGSIYLPENRGTWAVFDLGNDKTLIVALYDADLGGRLPGPLVRSFTKRQLRNYLESTSELTAQVLSFYDGTRIVHDGFGAPIPRRQVANVFEKWNQ